MLISLIEQALADVSQADGAAVIATLAPCLIVDSMPGTEGGVLAVRFEPSVGFGFQATYGIAVWRQGNQWRTASLLQDDLGNGSILVDATPSADGWDAVALWRVDGSGVIGAWRLYRLGATLVQEWQSPGGTHFSGRRLAPGLLLSTYLDTGADWELTQSRFCCGNKQQLWSRTGDSYSLLAERLYPSPRRTARVFADALRLGALDRAAELVTESAVLEAILKALGTPARIQLGNEPPGLAYIEQAESGSWEAIPAPLGGKPSIITRLIWPTEQGALTLVRVDGEWKVSGLTVPDKLCQPLDWESLPVREQELGERIRVALQGVSVADAQARLKAVLGCVEIEAIEGSGGALLEIRWDRSVRNGYLGSYGFVLWQSDEALPWRIAPLAAGSASNGHHLRKAIAIPHGWEVLGELLYGGNGGMGEFELLRFTDQMDVLWLGGGGSWFDATILTDRLILTQTLTSADLMNEPLSMAAWRSCCQNTQRLLQREGDEFVEIASRQAPSILRTATLFELAWNRQDWERAANLTADPNMVPTMRQDGPESLRLVDRLLPQIMSLQRAEWAYWEALPPEFNGLAPTTEAIIYPASPRPLLLQRLGEEWWVAGWGD